MHYSNVQPRKGRVRGLDGAKDMLTREGRGFSRVERRNIGHWSLGVGRGSQEVLAMVYIQTCGRGGP